MIVLIPLSEVLIVDKGIKGCLLEFDRHFLVVDLLVNIILGMNWLSENSASVNYRAKFVSFSPPR